MQRHCNRLLRFLAAAALLASASLPAAAQVEFCYADLNDTQYIWGTEKREHYDLAVKVKGESFAGAKITGLRAYFPAENYSEPTGWASSELLLEDKKNAPDICSQTALIADGQMRVSFPTPVTVPPEGVYVGYSFTITSLEAEGDSYPVPVSIGREADGFFVHTERTFLKWKAVSEYLGDAVMQLVVEMEGDFGAANVAISADAEQFAPLDKPEWNFPANLTSTGSEPISSVEISIATEGTEPLTQVKEFSPALLPQFGRAFPVEFTFPTNFGPGDHASKVTVTKVNGIENTASGKTANFSLHALARLVTKRPLLEEYTGIWCGNCPRGFAAMEYMAKTYPADFVGVAYHSGQGDDREEMQVIPEKRFPNYVGGYPTAWLDRTIELDPYFGTAGSGFGMADDWLNRRAQFTPVEVMADAVKEDGTVKGTATATFMYKSPADCDIELILLADGLTSDKWMQRNYYYKDNQTKYSLPELQEFCKDGKYGMSVVRGLIFNDVAVGTSGRHPLVDADEQQLEVPLTAEWTFSIADLVSTKGYDLGQMAEQFRIVAVVTDRKDGSVLNCISSAPVSNLASVEATPAGADVPTEWYDLQGRRIAAPEGGCAIRLQRMADGTVNASKIITGAR